jgi:hypothetical protein
MGGWANQTLTSVSSAAPNVEASAASYIRLTVHCVDGVGSEGEGRWKDYLRFSIYECF